MTDDRKTSTLPDGDASQRVADGGVRSERRRHPLRTISLVVGFVVMMVTAVIAGKHVRRDSSIADSPLLGKPAPAIQLPGSRPPAQSSPGSSEAES